MAYKVAIIGAGPAGFYAAGALFKNFEDALQVDIFEKLPAPYGLVRYGVAPDHEKIKNVRRIFDRTGDNQNFRFFGNVEYGKDLSLDDLSQCYDHIVFAVGCQSARKLQVDGEDLPNVISATEFVYWYNAHPEYTTLTPDFSGNTAVVVGAGNVALDVARILIRDLSDLKKTDIADHTLHALESSQIKDVYVLSRRGPAQAKFTSPELKEFGELNNVQALVVDDELKLDADSQALHDSDRATEKIYGLLNGFDRVLNPKVDSRVHFRFLVSPTSIAGDKDGVSGLTLVRNRLEKTESGYLNAVSTEQTEHLRCQLVVPSVGYRGEALTDLPFDDKRGRIPNDLGRIDLDDGKRIYVVGWSKRGPSGVVGTNKADAAETVALMIEDFQSSEPKKDLASIDDLIDNLVAEKDLHPITFQDWLSIKNSEEQRGEKEGRPRVKYTKLNEFLQAISK